MTKIDAAVNRFRRRRGERLAALIAEIAAAQPGGVRVLDLGGRPAYWDNVALDGIAEIVLLNESHTEFEVGGGSNSASSDLFRVSRGDARDLSEFDDDSFDLVHSNSVIEHVGGWPDMEAMAREARRVGASGWVQTPAWEFPFEPHFGVPFAHWLGRPLQTSMLRCSVDAGIRRQSHASRRSAVDRVNLLTRREVQKLFPNDDMFVERFALAPKSYCVYWRAPSLMAAQDRS
ncbi:MAG: class I SAM-dependent methyltransferase [Actinomycetota bacterium]